MNGRRVMVAVLAMPNFSVLILAIRKIWICIILCLTHDWQDEVMGENPINYSTNVTIGGGTDKMRFTASLTQSEDKGIIMGRVCAVPI